MTPSHVRFGLVRRTLGFGRGVGASSRQNVNSVYRVRAGWQPPGGLTAFKQSNPPMTVARSLTATRAELTVAIRASRLPPPLSGRLIQK